MDRILSSWGELPEAGPKYQLRTARGPGARDGHELRDRRRQHSLGSPELRAQATRRILLENRREGMEFPVKCKFGNELRRRERNTMDRYCGRDVVFAKRRTCISAGRRRDRANSEYRASPQWNSMDPLVNRSRSRTRSVLRHTAAGHPADRNSSQSDRRRSRWRSLDHDGDAGDFSYRIA